MARCCRVWMLSMRQRASTRPASSLAQQRRQQSQSQQGESQQAAVLSPPKRPLIISSASCSSGAQCVCVVGLQVIDEPPLSPPQSESRAASQLHFRPSAPESCFGPPLPETQSPSSNPRLRASDVRSSSSPPPSCKYPSM